MSFFFDIPQGNTGGLCWYDVSADSLAELISPALACGLTQEKDAQSMKLRREMRHHLPALQQNHHHRTSGSVTTEDVLNALEQYANPVLAML